MMLMMNYAIPNPECFGFSIVSLLLMPNVCSFINIADWRAVCTATNVLAQRGT